MNSRADGPRFEEYHMEIDTKLLEKLAELKKEQSDTAEITTASDKPAKIENAENPASSEQTGSDTKTEKSNR